jgi:hypothetical protein
MILYECSDYPSLTGSILLLDNRHQAVPGPGLPNQSEFFFHRQLNVSGANGSYEDKDATDSVADRPDILGRV